MRSVVSWIPSEAEPEKEIFLRMLLESAPREEKGRKKQEWAEGEGRLTGNFILETGLFFFNSGLLFPLLL